VPCLEKKFRLQIRGVEFPDRGPSGASKGRDVVFMPRLCSVVLIGGDTCHPWKVKARLHFLAARTCNCTAQQKGIVRIRTASTYPQPLDQPLPPPSPRLEPLGSFTTYLQSSLSNRLPPGGSPSKSTAQDERSHQLERYVSSTRARQWILVSTGQQRVLRLTSAFDSWPSRLPDCKFLLGGMNVHTRKAVPWCLSFRLILLPLALLP
jgi:hypothetical protein